MQRPSATAKSDDDAPVRVRSDPTPKAEQAAATQQLQAPPLDETLTQSPTPASGVRSSGGGPSGASPDPGCIPGYELLGEIARGGMGIVFRARQLGLNRIVAIKMVRGGQLADPEDLARFQAEAEAIARLRHPHIVTIYEVAYAGSRGEHPFFSMEYIAGRSLLMAAYEKPFTSREAAELTSKIARAIQYAHEHGVLHRDLKPSNVLLDEQGEPHVTDFGLAKRIDDDSGLTMTGSIVGTPCYMAPEQALGRASQAGPAADIYSLGAMLYELLTGRPPFRGETVVKTLRQVTDDDPVPLSRLSPSIPADLETICLKCLQKDPRRRYATAADLADDLARFLAGEPVSARPVGRLERLIKWCRRKPAQAGIAGVLIIAAAVLGLVWGLYHVRLVQANADLKVAAVTANTKTREAQQNYAEMRRNYYALQFNDAASLWQDAHPNVERAIDLLASLRPKPGEEELRRFEWYHLWHLCREPAPSIEHAAADGFVNLQLLQFLDDGRLAVFWNTFGDGELELYSGTQRVGQMKIGDAVEQVALSKDGRLLAVGESKGTITLYDVSAEPRLVRSWKAHAGRIRAFAFSASGELLASAAGEEQLRVWRVADGVQTTEYNAVIAIDGRLIVTDQGAVLVDAEGGAVRLLSAAGDDVFGGPLDSGDTVADFALSPDERTLVMLIPGKFLIHAWDLETRKKTTYELGPHLLQPARAAFAPDGEHLAFGANSMCAILNLRTRQVRTFKGHVDDPQLLAIASDLKSAASADRAGRIKVWDLTAEQQGCVARSAPGSVAFLDHSPNGRRVVYGGYNVLAEQGYGIVADATTGQPLVQWQSEHYPARGAFSPDGQRLLIVVNDRDGDGPTGIELRSGASGELIQTIAPEGTAVWDAAFLDDTTLLLACDDGRLVKWSIDQSRELAGVEAHVRGTTTYSVKKLVVSASRHVAASLGEEGQLRVWETGNLKRLASSGPHLITDEVVALAPHKSWVVRPLAVQISKALQQGRTEVVPTGIEERSLALVDFAQNREVYRFGGHKDMITAAAFNADGARLATGDSNGNVIVWDTTTGHELLTFQAHINQVLSISFAPDDRSLVTGGSDLMLRIWQGSKEGLGTRGSGLEQRSSTRND